jgi:hypothetical protein
VPHLNGVWHARLGEHSHPRRKRLFVIVRVQEFRGAVPEHLRPSKPEHVQHQVVDRSDNTGEVLAHSTRHQAHHRSIGRTPAELSQSGAAIAVGADVAVLRPR